MTTRTGRRLDGRARDWVGRVAEVAEGLGELSARWGTLDTEERRVHAKITRLLGRVRPDLAALVGDISMTEFAEAHDEASGLWAYYMETAELAGIGGRA